MDEQDMKKEKCRDIERKQCKGTEKREVINFDNMCLICFKKAIKISLGVRWGDGLWIWPT